jgi:hypothetical protein
MDALEIIRVLLRRWGLTLVLGLVLGAVLFAVMYAVPQQHQARGEALVIHQTSKEIANPYGSVDKAQGQAASLVVRVLTAPQTRTDLVRQGGTAEVKISNEGGSVEPDSPFISLVVTGANRTEVLRTGQIVLRRARDELKVRQDKAGVAPDRQLVLTEIVPVDTTATTRAAQLRAVGLGGALGLVLLVMIVVVHDQRKIRKERPPRVRPPVRRMMPDEDSGPRAKATYQRLGRTTPPPTPSPRAPLRPDPSIPGPPTTGAKADAFTMTMRPRSTQEAKPTS